MPDRSPTAHLNNFGPLRLLFASLVIVAHSPQIIDGSLQREPFTQLFGTITLGAFAVDFFFIISGFLIVGSFLSSQGTISYLTKRFLRIYPAFIVAYLACIFLIGPLVGGQLSTLGGVDYLKIFARMAMLELPQLPGAFSSLPEPVLNSAMWTISYEFRCYLLVPILAAVGILGRRRAVLVLTAALLLAYAAMKYFHFNLGWGPLAQYPIFTLIVRHPIVMIRFAGLFLAGACFRLYRDEIRFDGRIAAVCAVVATLLMFVPSLAEFGLATVGAYAMFWVAFTKRLPFLRHVNNDWDISYGVYLYGWPIGSLLLLALGDLTPLELGVATFVAAVAVGFASWKIVEEPCLRFKARRIAPRAAEEKATNAALGSPVAAVGQTSTESQK